MASAISCRACRRTVLESFASFAGLSLRPTTRIPVTRASPAATTVLSPPNTRFFRTISTPLRQEASTETKPDPSHNAQTTSEFQPYSASTTAPASDPSIPWYMQYETPEPLSTMTQNPLLASQEIPPIPHDAPAILEPILQHLSITIGLDNLSLLDLRELNPPAALGSNLLMIIGTARSQKHLNTSADRFCRWMRSEYKLRPFADGLLGRNEMKLKLRRKNRRLKLARTVGNTVATEGVDDGISTGWICCNLGSVSDVVVPESSNTKTEEARESTGHVRLSQKDQERILENEEEEYKNPTEDFVYRGFGDSADQVKIVVQMFVEEKRAEMDLEGLWETRVMRREKREESLDYRPEFEDEDTPLDAEEVQKKLEEFQKDDESHIEEEIENEKAREGEDVSKPLGGIGAS